MEFRYRETVEICSKEDLMGSFYRAKILAAVGKTRYLVQYQTLYSNDKTRLLTAAIDASEIRPLPPELPVSNFSESDHIDAYVGDAWWVGKIVRKVDPNYVVLLDTTGAEHHLPFYKVRLHLDWEDGTWAYPRSRPQDDDNQAKANEQGS